MTADRRVSPLRHLHGPLRAVAGQTGGALAVEEVPCAAMLDLRAAAGDRELLQRLGRALGLDWPVAPNRFAVGRATVFWLGPDEWLVWSERLPAQALRDELLGAADAGWVTATDVSAQRTTLRLDGPGAREVLMTGCAIDLEPDAMPVGSCAQTLLARAGVLLAVAGARRYVLLVRSSFADYAARWLLDATAELRV